MTYTLGMAARATGLSKSTIYRAIKAGRISAAPCQCRYEDEPHGKMRAGKRSYRKLTISQRSLLNED